MIRTSLSPWGSLVVACAALLLAAVPVRSGPFFGFGVTVGPRGGGGAFAPGFFAPSTYGYNLDDIQTGYYGGSRYREFYSYGRGYGLANYPGPLPGPVYRSDRHHREPDLWPARPPVLPPHYVPTNVLFAPPPQASLLLDVPAEAEVWIEGARTQQQGPSRLFLSPPLTPGEKYAYDIRVRWIEKGQPVEQSKQVVVQPGDKLRLTFPARLGAEDLPSPGLVPSTSVP